MRPRLLIFLLACCIVNAVSGQHGKPKTPPYVRLIFIANCFTPAENSAFRFAAANLDAEYERDRMKGGIVKRIYFDNARQIVDSINSQRQPIQSVDFLSHAKNDRIGAEITRRNVQYRTSLFESGARMAEIIAHHEGEGLANSRKMASIDEIDFTKFAYDAIIEIHGCHGGTQQDSLPDNISKRLSLALYNSGKQLAVVIGHGTRANPNPTSPANFKSSVITQDYRHGLRMVYFNGKLILSTRQVGAIPQSAIYDAIIQDQSAPTSAKAGR